MKNKKDKRYEDLLFEYKTGEIVISLVFEGWAGLDVA